MYEIFRSAHQINCQKSCGDTKALDIVEANLFSGVNVIFFASRTICMANSTFPCSFRKTPKVMSYTRHSQSISSLFENSFQLVENAYTVVEAATGTGTASGFDVLTHPGRSKHIELDLHPCVHTDPRLVVDLPVFLPELRVQMYKMVGGTVAPKPLSVSKQYLI